MIGTAITIALVPLIQKINQPLAIEQPKQDYYSLIAYCNLNKIKVNFSELKKMGMDLRRLTLDKGLKLRKIPDERWGEVNSYPVAMLDEYFEI